MDNLNGPTGLFLIAGIGVMRTAVIHEDLLVDGVPVDTCANLIIAVGWKTDKDYRYKNCYTLELSLNRRSNHVNSIILSYI